MEFLYSTIRHVYSASCRRLMARTAAVQRTCLVHGLPGTVQAPSQRHWLHSTKPSGPARSSAMDQDQPVPVGSSVPPIPRGH
jgi:hypothetical protein